MNEDVRREIITLWDRVNGLERGAHANAGHGIDTDRAIRELSQRLGSLERWREDEEEAKTVRVYVPAPGPCSRLGDVTAKLDEKEWRRLTIPACVASDPPEKASPARLPLSLRDNPTPEEIRNWYARTDRMLAEKDKEIARLKAAKQNDETAALNLLRQRDAEIERLKEEAVARNNTIDEARKARGAAEYQASLWQDTVARLEIDRDAGRKEIERLKAECRRLADLEYRATGEACALRAGVDLLKRAHEGACVTIAEMHEAATGVRGSAPISGVVEDVRRALMSAQARGDTYKRRCEAAARVLELPAGADPRTVFQTAAAILSGKVDAP